MTTERSVPLRNRLREQRLAAGLSQRELAERAGFEQGQVSKWERGRYRLSLATAGRLCAVLGCHAEELLSPEREVPLPA